LNRADIVVVPSYSEGQGLVAIEAMASGKPLVASNVGGLAEVIVNGETGILIPPKNSGALADAILTLLADPGRATAMGTAGKLRAQANYSVAQMIDSVQKLYLSIVHQDGT
jgi:starch synthase